MDQWGEIYKNESGGVGVIGSVVEDRAHLGISEYQPNDLKEPAFTGQSRH